LVSYVGVWRLVEKVLRINVITLLGVAIAAIAYLIPVLSGDIHLGATMLGTSDYSVSDIAAGNVGTWFDRDILLGGFISLYLAGMAVSLVTPLGGFMLLFGGLSVLCRIPYLISYRPAIPPPPGSSHVIWSLEPGAYLMVAAGAVVLVSIFVRVVLTKRSFQLEHGVGRVLGGLQTVSYGKVMPELIAGSGTKLRPNMAFIVGIMIGVGALFLSWTNGSFSGAIGLDLLLGNHGTTSNLILPLQVTMIFCLLGLISTVYTPLGGTVQLTSVLAYMSTAGVWYSPGPWLFLVSSIVLIHGVVMPVRDSQGGTRLDISRNLRTFRRI
jgi:hypothetical protein